MNPRFAHLTAAVAAAVTFASPAFAAKDVIVAVASTFVTTDPYDANDTLTQAVAKSFYQGLYGFDRNMKMVPVLAESHEASKDGLVYTVKLKKGIKFHDGTDFNAEAVKVTFDRVTNPENKLKRYVLYKNIAKTEVVDPYTVKFTLHEPFSPFINSLAHPSGVIISPAALQKYGKEIARNPVGTGPFKFVEWKQSDYMKVEKFPGYWRKGFPKVDTITWRPVVDNNSRAAMMQTNEAHFTFPVPYEQAEVLKGKPNLELTAAPSIVHRYMSMNTLQKPFDNVKVREAINYAINKEALAKVAFSGYAVPAEGVLPNGVEYAVKLGPWPYDPAKARALLKEAGYTGTPVRWITTKEYQYMYSNALVAKQQLEEAGFKIDLQVVDWATLVQRRNKPEVFDVFSTAITFNPEPAYNTGVQCNWPGWWCNEDKERWLDSVARESEPRKRKAMWEKVQQHFYEDAGRVKFGDFFTLEVLRKDVHGYTPTNELQLWNVWLAR